jgi:hypothetical protein
MCIRDSLNMHTLNKPEVMVARAWELFDQEGELADPETRGRIAALLQALVEWSRRLNPPITLEGQNVGRRELAVSY